MTPEHLYKFQETVQMYINDDIVRNALIRLFVKERIQNETSLRA